MDKEMKPVSNAQKVLSTMKDHRNGTFWEVRVVTRFGVWFGVFQHGLFCLFVLPQAALSLRKVGPNLSQGSLFRPGDNSGGITG